MKTKDLLLAMFVVLGVLFILGATMDIRELLIASNFFLIPFLLRYYRSKTKKIFFPIVGVLLLFYLRDIFLIYGFEENPMVIWIAFLLAMLILFLCLITGFQKSKVHPVEILSFAIMYGFLGFLFFSLSEIIPEVLPSEEIKAYAYILILILFLAGSFTVYIVKSHLASLWFLVAASALLVSEISLFFKIFIVEDFSVNFFYPFFHVLAYYSFVEYALRRRSTNKIPFF